MADDAQQRNVHKFLSDRFISQDSFSKDDLFNVTNWKDRSTTWSKHFEPLVVPTPEGKYRVSEAFRPFIHWKKFQRYVTQKRHLSAEYDKKAFDNVVIYEFYMPLTNESALRTTLDALFFKDNILPKLKAIDQADLKGHFIMQSVETQDVYFDRICSWIDSHFVGYSVYHVNGRFRASKLSTRQEATEIENSGLRYLVDETTAVSRFIFPCRDSDEAKLVRYFFDQLFVQSIIQVINGEDEIWMVESGMENRVHIWEVPDSDDE